MWSYLFPNSQQLRDAAGLAQVPAPVSVTKAATTSVLNYITLGSFSWDQDLDKIKVLLIKFIQSHFSAEVLVLV